MGRGVTKCFVGLPNNPQKIHRRDSISFNVWEEAVISAEISLCSARISGFASVKNEELMVKQLDSLEEFWELVTIRLADYQQKLAW